LWLQIGVRGRNKADAAPYHGNLRDAPRRHTDDVAREAEAALAHLRRQYYLAGKTGLAPAVYCRLTDNWLELTLRFVAREHGVRELKDAMSRDILAALDAAGIGIASATYDIVGFPPIRIERTEAPHPPPS
jgi:hypothetical protein